MIQGSLLFSVHLYLLLSHTLVVSLLPSRRFNALYAAPPPSSEGGETALRAAAAEILVLIDSLRNHGIADLLESGDVCTRFKVITKTVFLSSPDVALFVVFPAQGAGNAFFLILVDSLRNHGAADLLKSGDVCARFKVITKTVFLSSPDAALID